MNAGRELDAAIAEHVMGCKVQRPQEGIDEPGISQSEFEKRRRQNTYHCHCDDSFDRPHEHYNEDASSQLKEYSTDIAAAFEVVAKVMPTYKSKISIETYEGEVWSIKPCGTSSKSLPHAICLAALRAVGFNPAQP